jgi:TetR/AcrR family transcriptional regulator, ethionamide resistance regulator
MSSRNTACTEPRIVPGMSGSVLAVGDGAGRRFRSHTGRSGPELAIFQATERLLQTKSLHEISVAQILCEAGVSRAAFYYYFASKHDVVASLLAEVFDEIFASIEPWTGGFEHSSPEVLRRSLLTGVDLWTQQGHILAAAIENMHTAPQLRTLWVAFLDRFTQAVAHEIERERADGTAPPGPPAQAIAGALVWGSERVLYLGLRGLDPAVDGVAAAGDALLELWFASIYGPDRGPGSRA